MPDACPLIHEAVAAQAAARPAAVAVVDGCGTRTTYAELDAAASAWAAGLAALGVGPGTLIPVRLPRSARLTATLLAVLKCGAGYACVDMRWPAARVEAVVSRLRPPVVIADELPGGGAVGDRSAPGRPPEAVGWRPGELREAAVRAVPGPRPPISPEAPACVFFTSGTSGPPKGVVSPHRATTRLFDPQGPLAFGPGRVMTQAAPVPWDAWSLELWGMLATGGTTVVVDDDYLLPGMLARAVEAHGVNTAWLTASVFHLFALEDPDCFAGIDRLLVGGERLAPDHVRAFLARYPDTVLLNGYGPVESCVFATTHRVRPEDCDAPYGIPIGRPVPGTGVHVRDGELCVSGAGLALGYLGDPDLTAARFPTLDIDGRPVRVYRTGDRGVRDADGVLHFTGRTDRQVKIRGHRIEPEGVEAEAARLPHVGACAAVPVPGALGGYERLALYYTPAPDAPELPPGPDPLRVRRRLAERLPRYSVPDVVRILERLPVTANGKVDLHALAGLAGG